MEACQVIAEIPSCMGRLAKFKIWAVSLQEATDIVNGLNRIERENFRRACLELNSRLSALKLGQVPSGLSTTATPFVPLAASSAAAMGQPGGARLPPQGGGFHPTRPLYTNDDEGATTDSTLSSVSSRALSHKRGSRGKHKKRTQEGGTVSDSCTSSSTSKGEKRKKARINAKVTIPEFGGKATHPKDTVKAFRQWACTVACHWEYYENEYFMSQVIASLKDDAAQMFDFAHRNNPGADLGVIIEKLRHHYCGAITFSKQ